jgi:hypothetical protein
MGDAMAKNRELSAVPADKEFESSAATLVCGDLSAGQPRRLQALPDD